MIHKPIFRSMALAVVVSFFVWGVAPGQGGSAPQITFISFDAEIKADGNPVSGFVGFKDPDGDVIRAEFDVVQATDFQPFSFDPKVKGAKEGVFEFALATRVPQRVTLKLTLVDEAGNRSQPKDFSFEAVAPILQVTPTSLSFSEQVGRTPASQTIQIINAGRGTINWTASVDQPWISLSPSMGVAPATVTVSINTAGLTVGSYAGRIIVEAPGIHGSPAVVTVNLTLTPVPPAMLEVSPEKLEFRGQEGAGNPTPQPMMIRNVGGQPLTWTAQANVTWLSLNRASGTLQAGESIQLAVSVNLTGLSPGVHQAQITITAPEARNSPVTVNVTLVLESRSLLRVCPRGCPYSRIQDAINAALPESILRIEAGTYRETLTVTKSLILIGVGADQVTIQAAERGKPVLFIESSTSIEVRVEGLTIKGAQRLSDERFCFEYEPRWICPYGISVHGQARLVLSKAQLSENASSGIFAEGQAQVEVRNTIVKSNRSGVGATDNAQLVVEDSTITNNQWNGLGLGDQARATVNNNTVEGNLICGIEVASSNARAEGSQNAMRGNGADLCGYASASLRVPLTSQTDRREISFPGDGTYKSLQEAVDAIAPGGTITIAGGSFAGSITLWKPLVLRGAGGEQTRLRAAAGRHLVLSITAEGQGVRLERLAVTDSQGDGLLIYGQVSLTNTIISGHGGTAIVLLGAAVVQIKDSFIKDNVGEYTSGIAAFDSVQLSIENTTVSGNSDGGIWVGDSARATITSNTISGNGSSGIWVSNAAEVTIQGNTVSNNGDDGITVYSDPPQAKATIIENAITNNEGYGIYTNDPRNIVSCYGNTIYGNQSGSYNDSAAQACR